MHAGAEPAHRRPLQPRASTSSSMQGLDRPQLYDWSQKLADAMARDPPLRRRHQRPAGQRHRRRRWSSTRTRPARSASPPTQLRSTLYSRLRHRQVSTIYGTGDSYEVIMEFDPTSRLDDRERARRSASATTTGKLVPLGAFARVERTAGLAHHQPARPAAGGDDLVQPAARACRSARRSTRIDEIKSQLEHARRRSPPPSPARPRPSRSRWPTRASAARGGDRHDLHRARHPLRELHPPADDPDRPAVGGVGRAAGARAVRHGPQRHRRDRPPDADRHRQEERDHDDRRRAGAAARRASRRARRSTRPA